MKGHQKTTMLYVLQGSIVTRDIVVASRSLSEDDITKLRAHASWAHERNGMAKLSRRGLLDGQKTS